VLHRAYSVLEVKTFDPITRTLEGIATTPSTDRMGDVIEPLGATFAASLPLLLFHDTRQPVGTVALQAPTANGIAFRATLPQVAAPGRLRERIDEAWESVKAGLIRGVSIGFRPLENGIEILKSGGLRFTKTEILELSLVAIPANADARIDTIKAIDAPHLLRSRPPMKSQQTTLEQIQGFQAMRAAKAARMSELMNAAAESGVTLDDPASDEYDTLETDVASLDKHLVRLNGLEAAMRASAAPVAGSSTHAAVVSRSGGREDAPPRIYLRDNLPPGIPFARAVMCKLEAFRNQGSISPLAIAKARYPDSHEIHQYLERGAVPAGSTTDPTWAGALTVVPNLISDFLAWLRPQTIVGQFGQGGVPSLRRVPFNVGIAGQTSGGLGYWVGQGKAKPLTKFDFDRQTLLWSKVAAISVINEELARFSSPSAEMLVRDGLRDAIVERLDIDFVDPAHAAIASVSPASITNGVTPIVSSGATADDIRDDMVALIGSFVSTNQNVASLVLIMPNTVALALSLMRNALGQPEFTGIGIAGGNFQGVPVIASQYAHTAAAGNMLIAANAQMIALADDDAVSVEASREASLEMSDAPTANSTTPTGATAMVSMWQTNSIALKAERFINWQKLRAGAVQYISHLAWGGAPGS
jgi:HK97 family phage major capsid protein/HK97 family phage prohead protease